jgi:hypothetical protein
MMVKILENFYSGLSVNGKEEIGNIRGTCIH